MISKEHEVKAGTSMTAKSKTNPFPQNGQVWEHYSGNRFSVVLIANEGAIDRDKYPMTAVLQDDFGRMWAVPVFELCRNFTYTGETSMTGCAGGVGV